MYTVVGGKEFQQTACTSSDQSNGNVIFVLFKLLIDAARQQR
jgi:hypothetical protein